MGIGVAQSLVDPSFDALLAAFYQLEGSLPHLYHQILTTLTSCHTFSHSLLATFRHILPSPPTDDDGTSYGDDDAYFSILDQVQSQADAMEQAVTLTVLGPLQTLMQRCALLRHQLSQRDELVINYDLLKLETPHTDPRLIQAWQEYQSFTRDMMDDMQKLQSDTVDIRAELFQIMVIWIVKHMNK